jgi:hypothetical protein
VLALLRGQPVHLGEGVGQVGAHAGELGVQLRVVGFEGGDEPVPAVPPGSLPFGRRLWHSGWRVSRYATDVPGSG